MPMSTSMYRLEVRSARRAEEEAAKTCLTEHAAEVAGISSRARSWDVQTMRDQDVPFSVLAMSHDRVVGGLIGKIFFN